MLLEEINTKLNEAFWETRLKEGKDKGKFDKSRTFEELKEEYYQRRVSLKRNFHSLITL